MEQLLYSFMDFAPTLGILLSIGALAGVIGGMFGIGGGIVIVPILYYISDKVGFIPAYEMQIIMATSLGTIIFTGLGSLKTHISHKEISWEAIKGLAPLMFFGAILGAYLNSLFSAKPITLLFAIFCLGLGAKMLIKVKAKRTETIIKKHFSRIGAVLIGTFSALMGVGGGTMSVPFLRAYGFPMKISTGTSSILSSIIAISGTLSYIVAGWSKVGLDYHYLGYVNWLALLCIVPTTMLFAPVGAWLARCMSDLVLARAFAAFLIINATKMLWNIFN